MKRKEGFKTFVLRNNSKWKDEMVFSKYPENGVSYKKVAVRKNEKD